MAEEDAAYKTQNFQEEEPTNINVGQIATCADVNTRAQRNKTPGTLVGDMGNLFHMWTSIRGISNSQ